MKKAHVDDLPSFLGGLALSLALIIIISVGCTLIVREYGDTRALAMLDRFADYYQTCLGQTKTDCYCEPSLDITLLPDEHTISIIPTDANTLTLQLQKDDFIVQTKTIPGTPLCLYSLIEQPTPHFEEKPAHQYFFPAMRYVPAMGQETPHSTELFLYHTKTSVCFVQPYALRYDPQQNPFLFVDYPHYSREPKKSSYTYEQLKLQKQSCTAEPQTTSPPPQEIKSSQPESPFETST